MKKVMGLKESFREMSTRDLEEWLADGGASMGLTAGGKVFNLRDLAREELRRRGVIPPAGTDAEDAAVTDMTEIIRDRR